MNELLKVEENNRVVVAEELQDAILDLQERKKALKEDEDNFKEILIKAMKDNNVSSFKVPGYNVSYVAESNSFIVDSEKLEKEEPEVYRKYLKPSHKNESVRISPSSRKK